MKLRYRLAALAGAAWLTTSGMAVAGTKPPTSEWAANARSARSVLAQFPMIGQPRMSPDGKWVATRIRVSGEQVLAIVPVHPTDGKPVIVARMGEAAKDKQADRRIEGYHWADSAHLVIEFWSRDNYYGNWFDHVRYAGVNARRRRPSSRWGGILGWGRPDDIVDFDLGQAAYAVAACAVRSEQSEQRPHV